MDAREWRAREIAGIEDHQIGRLVDRVDDKANQPTLIFGSVGMSADKNELTWITLRPEAVHAFDAGFQIVFEQAIAAEECWIGRFRQHHRIGIAIGLAGPALVDTRKILWMSVDHVTPYPSFDRIDRPALERAARGVRSLHGPGENTVVGDGIENHASVVRVVGIRHV